MKAFLMLMGGAATIVVCFVMIAAIFHGIKELIDVSKRRYIIKHRFDKPPTAACYCRDCKRHDDESHRCYKFDGWYTADNWFCWDAEPRKEIK